MHSVRQPRGVAWPWRSRYGSPPERIHGSRSGMTVKKYGTTVKIRVVLESQRNRQLVILISNSEQEVDDFVGEFTL